MEVTTAMGAQLLIRATEDMRFLPNIIKHGLVMPMANGIPERNQAVKEEVVDTLGI
jgi:hypothetical protein